MPYDFMSKVTLEADPVEDGHTRYLLLLADAPSLVTIDGLIDFWIARQDPSSMEAQQDLRAIMVLTPDGEIEAINIEKNSDGLWLVYQSHNDGGVIEEIQYNPNDDSDILHHEVYIKTFETDQVPVFVAQSTPA